MDRQQVLWTIGGSFGGGVIVTVLAHHFANLRGKREAHRKASDKAQSEIEKALNELRDWGAEVQKVCTDEDRYSEANSISFSKLANDKRALDWLEKFKDNAEIVPGLLKVAYQLSAHSKGIALEIQSIVEMPLSEGDDRQEVKKYFSVEGFRRKRKIAEQAKDHCDLIQQLKSFVKYLCMKDVMKIRRPFYYSHGRQSVLNFKRKDRVVLGDETWEDLHPFNTFVLDNKWMVAFFLITGMTLLLVSRLLEK